MRDKECCDCDSVDKPGWEMPCTACNGGKNYERAVGDKQTLESDNPFNRQVGGDHYKKEGLPDVTEWCMRHEMDIGEFNVVKYVFRHGKKNGLEDLRKAAHYLEFIAWIKYGEALYERKH